MSTKPFTWPKDISIYAFSIIKKEEFINIHDMQIKTN